MGHTIKLFITAYYNCYNNVTVEINASIKWPGVSWCGCLSMITSCGQNKPVSVAKDNVLTFMGGMIKKPVAAVTCLNEGLQLSCNFKLTCECE